MYYLLMIHAITGAYQTVDVLGEYQSYDKCVRASAAVVKAVKEYPREYNNIHKFVCVEK